MSDLDSTDLARDLFDRLAATMPDNPQRVTSAVQQRVRRRHRRRVATRATIGLACVAGVGAVLVVGTSKRAEPVTPAAPGQTKTTASPATSATTLDPCQVKAATVGGGASTTIPSSDGPVQGLRHRHRDRRRCDLRRCPRRFHRRHAVDGDDHPRCGVHRGRDPHVDSARRSRSASRSASARSPTLTAPT